MNLQYTQTHPKTPEHVVDIRWSPISWYRTEHARFECCYKSFNVPYPPKCQKKCPGWMNQSQVQQVLRFWVDSINPHIISNNHYYLTPGGGQKCNLQFRVCQNAGFGKRWNLNIQVWHTSISQDRGQNCKLHFWPSCVFVRPARTQKL